MFEDALEEIQKPQSSKKKSKKSGEVLEVPLVDGLNAAREAIDKFLNNHFDEAKDIVEPQYVFYLRWKTPCTDNFCSFQCR